MVKKYKKELPKQRTPVPPPGFNHKSKKDYKRDKKVDSLEEEINQEFGEVESWDQADHDDFAKEDLKYNLLRMLHLLSIGKEFSIWKMYDWEWSKKEN
jgi:hypothetical protein